jgi:hypothetical protein
VVAPPDAAVLVVAPGSGIISNKWDKSIGELFERKKGIIVVNKLYLHLLV